MTEPKDIAEDLKALTRSLASGDSKKTLLRHRGLYEIGEATLPHIKKQILAEPWVEIRFGEQLNILTGLLCLARDINEDFAKAIVATIREDGCSKSVDIRMSSIMKFTKSEFEIFDEQNIDIYLSKDLNGRNYIKGKIAYWLSYIPKSDLEGIERIYFTPMESEEYSGLYRPHLCSIMVEWNMPYWRYNPFSYFILFSIEHTLYHEIGHHVYKHGGGREKEMEREADRYASETLRRSRFLFRMMRRILTYFRKSSDKKA